MKIYIRDFNNILIDLKNMFKVVDNPRNADVLVLWQDIRGDMLELCQINKEHLHKPVIVVQHGRGCTRDYLPPNKFPMLADKFCCWGKTEYDRLVKAGYKDRVVITGSPLIKKLKKKEKHEGKNIVFCPIITQHEEPENIITYWTLKRVEMERARKLIEKNKDALKNQWDSWLVDPTSVTDGSIPYHVLNKNWRVIAKLTGIHDKHLYLGDIVHSLQVNKDHIADCIKLLTMIDCVIGIEEGTFQLLAMAMDIPCIMVEGFTYRNYGGIDYSSIEMIKTNGVDYTSLDNLEKTIDNVLNNPNHLKNERECVVTEELGNLDSNPVKNIARVIREVKKKNG